LGFRFTGGLSGFGGASGKRPRITTASLQFLFSVIVLSLAAAGGLSLVLSRVSNAAMPFADASIFGLSILAQYLLDRKKIENWIAWGVVDLIAIYVYASQHLWVTSMLYSLLFLNVFWGYHEWRKELLSYQDTKQLAVA
jgi:nicotinamide mononucleotide transporter